MRWVETNGGPFILLPWEKRKLWEGADPPSKGRTVRAKFRWDGQAIATDYDEACDKDESKGMIRRKDFRALSFERYPKTWIGNVLVHWELGPSKPHVERLLRRGFDGVRFRKTRARIVVPRSKLVLFDAAYPGRSVPKKMQLVVALPPGTYAIESADWRPDDETLLVLYRFTRPSRRSR